MAQKRFFDDKCRCCLQNGTLQNMWDENCGEGEEIYGEMMNKCFAISWQKHEVEIEKICESCIERLQDAVDFKKMILTSEEVLLEYEELNEVSDTEYTDEQPKESEIVLIDMETDEIQDDKYLKEEYLDENDTIIRSETKGCSENIPKKENLEKSREVSSDSDELLEDEESESEPETIQIQNVGERDKLQDNLRAILLCSNATPLKAPTDNGYGCEFCKLAFHEPTHLKRHILSKHGDDVKSRYMKEVEMYIFFVRLDITGLYCKYCSENIDTIESLLEHLKTVHGEKVHTDIVRLFIPFKFQNSDAKCCQCNSRFQSFRALSRHMATHYRNYQCKTCCKWYMTRMSLRRHRQLHNTGVYPCSKCPRIFKNNICRRQHERSHFGERNFQSPCGICKERFCNIEVKKRHLAVVHGIKSYSRKHVCFACPKRFSRTTNLVQHMRSVHLNMPYICEICGKEYKKKNTLKIHIAWHQNTTPFACQICNKHFQYENSLNSHVQKEHQNNKSTGFDEFIHTCDFCQRKFSRRNTMLCHMGTAHNFWDTKNIEINAT